MPLQTRPSNGHVNKPQRPLTPCCNLSLIRWLVSNSAGFMQNQSSGRS
ncbi:hypothetical protein M5D96_003255 [Drosophila gunungcola]|uniref:Uncharacterized protein n=1 Tax=Drosophila gunungcola TaxID=103775 RepID=A0A9Q0BSA5_9MUSC|nr:hypothetical protein M5D96_003255 [Drosophila gunungcola]